MFIYLCEYIFTIKYQDDTIKYIYIFKCAYIHIHIYAQRKDDITMGKVISIFNQKGGVAKTTTASNLGSALARMGKKILLIDSDPQANCTNAVGYMDEDISKSLNDLLTLKKITSEHVAAAIMKTKFENLDLLPADISLAQAEDILRNAIGGSTFYRDIIKHVIDIYDYIFIDCPPSLGLLPINALTASDRLIIPVYPSYFSIKGLSDLMNTFELVKEKLNTNLNIMGVVLTKYDGRKNISKSIRSSLEEVFGNRVFKTNIRANAQIEYAQDNQMPVIFFDEKSNGYTDYMNLAQEVLNYEWQ